MKVCQAFRRLGHEVMLWLPGPDPDVTWEQLAEHYGLQTSFEIRWLTGMDMLRRYDFGIRAVIKAMDWSADIMYAWPLQSACLASTLNQSTLFEVHDRPRGNFGPLLFRLMLLGRGLRRILPISDALDAWLEGRYRVSLTRCDSLVIRSGVDLEGYRDLPDPSQARQQLGLSEALTVGYTGHLYPGRGIDLLFELAKRNRDTQFLWAGGTESSVESWKRKLESDNVTNVVLTGFISQEELPLYQAACEILVMPYEKTITVSSGAHTEKFASPMKVFEYMASGRAILSSDLPVLREVLHEGIAAFALPEDLESWDRQLKDLMADPKLRSDFAKASRAEAGKYSWEARAGRALRGLDDA